MRGPVPDIASALNVHRGFFFSLERLKYAETGCLCTDDVPDCRWASRCVHATHSGRRPDLLYHKSLPMKMHSTIITPTTMPIQGLIAVMDLVEVDVCCTRKRRPRAFERNIQS